MGNKLKTCGNCLYKERVPYNKYKPYIKFKCICENNEYAKYWSYNPINGIACKNHKFKNQYNN